MALRGICFLCSDWLPQAAGCLLDRRRGNRMKGTRQSGDPEPVCGDRRAEPHRPLLHRGDGGGRPGQPPSRVRQRCPFPPRGGAGVLLPCLVSWRVYFKCAFHFFFCSTARVWLLYNLEGPTGLMGLGRSGGLRTSSGTKHEPPDYFFWKLPSDGLTFRRWGTSPRGLKRSPSGIWCSSRDLRCGVPIYPRSTISRFTSLGQESASSPRRRRSAMPS